MGMTKLFKSLLFIMLISLVVSQTCTFQQYITQFNRSYTDEQKSARLAIFTKRILQIIEFNSGNHGYTIGCTRWTDRFDNQLPGKLDLEQTNSLTSQSDGIHISSSLNDQIIVGDSDYFDWRTNNGITSVKDQRSCGSCWAFATVAAIQSLLLIRSSQSYDLSEQYLLECSGSNSCSGGSYLRAFNEVLQEEGLPLETQYPYRASDSKQGICGTGDFKTITNLSVKVGRYLTDAQMMSSINDLPLSAVIIADHFFSQYKSGIFKCDYTMTDSMINHAVQVVGYNVSGNYYIIKNEWGTQWGMNGYAYVDMTQDCLIKREVWKADGTAGVMQNKAEDDTTKSEGFIKVGMMVVVLIASLMAL